MLDGTRSIVLSLIGSKNIPANFGSLVYMLQQVMMDARIDKHFDFGIRSLNNTVTYSVSTSINPRTCIFYVRCL